MSCLENFPKQGIEKAMTTSLDQDGYFIPQRIQHWTHAFILAFRPLNPAPSDPSHTSTLHEGCGHSHLFDQCLDLSHLISALGFFFQLQNYFPPPPFYPSLTDGQCGRSSSDPACLLRLWFCPGLLAAFPSVCCGGHTPNSPQALPWKPHPPTWPWQEQQPGFSCRGIAILETQKCEEKMFKSEPT